MSRTPAEPDKRPPPGPDTAAVAARVHGEAGTWLLRTLESTELLGDEKVVAINHHGTIYRLQATRLGKLILTK